MNQRSQQSASGMLTRLRRLIAKRWHHVFLILGFFELFLLFLWWRNLVDQMQYVIGLVCAQIAQVVAYLEVQKQTIRRYVFGLARTVVFIVPIALGVLLYMVRTSPEFLGPVSLASLECHIVGDSTVPTGLRGTIYLSYRDTSGIPERIEPSQVGEKKTFRYLVPKKNIDLEFVPDDTVRYPPIHTTKLITEGSHSAVLSLAARRYEVKFEFSPQNAVLHVQELSRDVRKGEPVLGLLPRTYHYTLNHSDYDALSDVFHIIPQTRTDTIVRLPALTRRRVNVRLVVVWEGYEDRPLGNPRVAIRKEGSRQSFTVPSGETAMFDVQTPYILTASASYVLGRPYNLADTQRVVYAFVGHPEVETLYVRVVPE